MTLPNKLQSIFTSEQKYTVLQLIKALIDATKEGTIANVEVVRTDAAHIVLRFITNDGTYYDTAPIVIGAADLDTVYAMLQASGNITITKNTSTGKVIIGMNNNITVDNIITTGSIKAGASVSTPKLTATGDSIEAEKPVIEKMTGYSFATNRQHLEDNGIVLNYVGVCKNGNKLTFVIAGKINSPSQINEFTLLALGTFNGIPSSIGAKIIPIAGTIVSFCHLKLYNSRADFKNCEGVFTKNGNTSFNMLLSVDEVLQANKDYSFRYEETFLLGDNLVS